MANQTFYAKVGDTGPPFRVTLRDGNKAAVDVSGSAIQFKMRYDHALRDQAIGANVLKVDAAGVIVNGTGGIVEYQWAAGDLDTPGRYRAEFEVTFGGGEIQTFPRPGYNWVEVEGDLDYTGIDGV